MNNENQPILCTQRGANEQEDQLGGTTNLSLEQLKQEGGIASPSEDNPEGSSDDLDEPNTEAYQPDDEEDDEVTDDQDGDDEDQSTNDADGNGGYPDEASNSAELNS